MTQEEIEDARRSWEAYQAVSDALVNTEYTNGDVLFVISVIVGELVRDEDFDLDEILDEIRGVALATIKATANS